MAKEKVILAYSGGLDTTAMIPWLKEQLAGVTLGNPDSANGKLAAILGNATIFGSDLTKTPLAARIEGYFREELAGPGAVRATLQKYV